MFSSSIYKWISRDQDIILEVAVAVGCRTGSVTKASEKDFCGNKRLMSEWEPIRACDLGLSFWDLHKLSIITDIVIALLIVVTCLGVGFGCQLPSPLTWAITGSSLGVAAVGIDVIGCKLNLLRLSNKLGEDVKAVSKEHEKRRDNRL